jgi:hypothetical protein
MIRLAHNDGTSSTPNQKKPGREDQVVRWKSTARLLVAEALAIVADLCNGVTTDTDAAHNNA